MVVAVELHDTLPLSRSFPGAIELHNTLPLSRSFPAGAVGSPTILSGAPFSPDHAPERRLPQLVLLGLIHLTETASFSHQGSRLRREQQAADREVG